MNTRPILKLIACFFFSILIFSSLAMAGNGENPADYLDLTTPAKYKALGQSYTAFCAGAESIWLNPAGLCSYSSMEIAVTGMQGIEDVSSLNGSVLLPLKQTGNIGIGFGYLGSPDEVFESASGKAAEAAALKFENYLLNIGYGIELYEIFIGAGLKYVHSELAYDKSILLLGNIGIQKRMEFFKLVPMPGNNFSIGLLLRDISIKNYEESEFGSIRAGFDYRFLTLGMLDLSLSADVGNYGFKNNYDLGTGLKIDIYKKVYLMGGYNIGTVDQVTIGAGGVFAFGQSGFEVDYASNPMSLLPSSHWIDLHYRTIKNELDQKAEEHFSKAEKNYDAEQYDDAEKELGQAMTIITRKKNEEKVNAYIAKADELLEKKDRPNAIKELQTALTIDPYSTKVYTKIAQIYYNDGDNKQAYDNVKSALKLDPEYQEAVDLEYLIVQKAEKEKSVWLTDDKYYTEQKLTFEDFATDTDISKFIAQAGQFERVAEPKEQYGRWRVTITPSDSVLSTAIRLPDLTRFDGIMVSIRSATVSRVDIVIVEQSATTERKWKVPISGLKAEWRHLKIPFRYFQCAEDSSAKLDLALISAVQIVVNSEFPDLKDMANKPGVILIDNLSFNKDK